VGQGVNVLLHTNRIWSEPEASTRWKTFDEYLRSDSLSGFVTLAMTAVAVCYLSWPARESTAQSQRRTRDL
jgi:hypothetical protein